MHNRRQELFTEQGTQQFYLISKRINDLLRADGCFRVAESGIYNLASDTQFAHVCLDRMVELGEIKLLTPGSWGQHEVYTFAKNH